MPRVIGTVFGLSDVYNQQILNTARSADNYWPAEAEYGIWVGNIDGPATAGSDIHRIDFSSDTAIDLGNNPIATARQGSAAACKQRFGWFMGGWPSGTTATSQIQRLDLTSDVVSIPQNWPAARSHIGGVSGEAYAYGAGGGITALGYSNTNKFDYSTETISPTSNYPGSRVLLQTSTNKDYGFFTGGASIWSTFQTKYSNTNKLDFSTDTYSASSDYPTNLFFEGATATTEHFAFMLGGGGTSPRSDTNRFDYTNETYSSSTNLPQAARGRMSVGDRSFGYLQGGNGPGVTETTYSAFYSTVSKLNFTTETFSNSVNLTPGGGSGFASAGGGVPRVPEYDVNGYSIGGYVSSNRTSLVQRYDFVSDTCTPTGNPDTLSRDSVTALFGKGFAYTAGGYAPGSTSSISRMDLNTEIIIASPLTLDGALVDVHSYMNASSYYGYFVGGATAYPGAYRSFVRRIDMTSETTSNPTTYPTNMSQSTAASSRALNKSYTFGGDTGSATNAIRSFDWSTESFNLSPTTMPVSKYELNTFENNLYNWVTGGPYFGANESRVWRWDYNTESVTTLSPIGATKRRPASFSSNYKGYLAGGLFAQTSIQEFDFSTETPGAATALSTGVGAQAAIQNI